MTEYAIYEVPVTIVERGEEVSLWSKGLELSGLCDFRDWDTGWRGDNADRLLTRYMRESVHERPFDRILPMPDLNGLIYGEGEGLMFLSADGAEECIVVASVVAEQ